MAKTLFLQRGATSNDGTFGQLWLPDGWRCFTLELPWRGNMATKSCIPPGTYLCSLVSSPKFGIVYCVHNVPNRSFILIHAGNWAGDVDCGRRSDVQGCILVGRDCGTMQGQPALLSSGNALTEFMCHLNGDDFILDISV